MVYLDTYRLQAESKERAARAVQENYPDWAVTMCFYSAIYWVNDYALLKGVDISLEYDPSLSTTPNKLSTMHQRRWNYIQNLSFQKDSKKLRKAYRWLWSESKVARYLENIESLKCTAYDYYINNKLVKVNLAFSYLSVIKTELSY